MSDQPPAAPAPEPPPAPVPDDTLADAAIQHDEFVLATEPGGAEPSACERVAVHETAQQFYF